MRPDLEIRSYCLLIESSPLFADDFFDFLLDFFIFDISLLLMLSPPAAGAAVPLS